VRIEREMVAIVRGVTVEDPASSSSKTPARSRGREVFLASERALRMVGFGAALRIGFDSAPANDRPEVVGNSIRRRLGHRRSPDRPRRASYGRRSGLPRPNQRPRFMRSCSKRHESSATQPAGLAKTSRMWTSMTWLSGRFPVVRGSAAVEQMLRVGRRIPEEVLGPDELRSLWTATRR